MPNTFTAATQFAVDMVKALGLEPHTVLRMSIHLSPMELPTVDVRVLVRDGDDLARVIQSYVLNPELARESTPETLTPA